jgi:hypothetical protein
MTTVSKENLVFNFRTIRQIIGGIALLLPLLVSVVPWKISPSISWTYYTNAHDIFVGCLFVIGAFLISYKGHQIILNSQEVGNFWTWLNRFWKGAIKFRIWERRNEEDWVATLGGIAALVTALCPTAFCVGQNCPHETTSTIHYSGAIILFSTTIYFCLVAFRNRVIDKIKSVPQKSGFDPKKFRLTVYLVCGWGIAVIMLLSVTASITRFDGVRNFTFWSETFALELFGIAWMIASQTLPNTQDETDSKDF